jgi:hypothetical protein
VGGRRKEGRDTGGREWNVGEREEAGVKKWFWRKARVLEVPIVSDISP